MISGRLTLNKGIDTKRIDSKFACIPNIKIRIILRQCGRYPYLDSLFLRLCLHFGTVRA